MVHDINVYISVARARKCIVLAYLWLSLVNLFVVPLVVLIFRLLASCLVGCVALELEGHYMVMALA